MTKWITDTTRADGLPLAQIVAAVPAVLAAADAEFGPADGPMRDTALDRARRCLHEAGQAFVDLYGDTLGYLRNIQGEPAARLDHAFKHWIASRSEWESMISELAEGQMRGWTEAVSLLSMGHAVRCFRGDNATDVSVHRAWR